MKTRLFALLLAVVMVFGLAAPAFADTASTTTETTQTLEDGSVVTTTVTVTVTTPNQSEEETDPAAPAESEDAALADGEETEAADGEETEAVTGGEIVILYTNDVHCGVEANIGYTGLALLKNALKGAGRNVLLVDNGDAVQGDTIGTLSKGEYIIDIMNKVGYDVATIGNHEFDYGMEQFQKNVARAEFPFVAANFTDAEGNAILDAYKIVEIAGKKVAFVGIVTPRTFTSSTPVYFQNEAGEYIYSFSEDETGEKLYAVVQAAVDAAKAEGADYVIALSHLGIEEDCSPWTSSEVITHTTGIDAFLDGHSHSVIVGETVKNKDGEDVILTSTGTKLAYVGCLTIDETGKLSTMLLDETVLSYGKLIGALQDDGGVAAAIETINAEFAELINTVVAHTDVTLVTLDPENREVRIVRSQETNLGDLCADAYRIVSGADIAFVNGGGVRAEIAAGDITYGQIISVHPFGNLLCVVETTGQEILDALELSVSRLPGEFGGFLHVSGLQFTIDLNVDSTVELNDKGEFVAVNGARRVKNVTVLNKETDEYEPLDPEKVYSLASHNYLLKNSGDGFSMFRDNTLLQDEVMLDNQVLITYIVEKLGGTVGEAYRDAYGEGRITIVEKGETLPEIEETETTGVAEQTEAAETAENTEETESTEAVENTEETETEPALDELIAEIVSDAVESIAAETEQSESVEETEAAETPVDAWSVYTGEAAVLPEDVQTAFDAAAAELSDVKLVPVAYLGYQVVAGMNHAILCTSTPVTEEEAEAVTSLVVAILYCDLQDHSTITNLHSFVLSTEEAESTDEPAETDEPLAGGWNLPETISVVKLPNEVATAFEKATDGLLGNTLEPIAYLGSQMVAGTNYAILCRSTLATETPVISLQVVIVTVDLEGNASIVAIQTVDVVAYTEAEVPAEEDVLPEPTASNLGA